MSVKCLHTGPGHLKAITRAENLAAITSRSRRRSLLNAPRYPEISVALLSFRFDTLLRAYGTITPWLPSRRAQRKAIIGTEPIPAREPIAIEAAGMRI
jgi:hypothetical protein